MSEGLKIQVGQQRLNDFFLCVSVAKSEFNSQLLFLRIPETLSKSKKHLSLKVSKSSSLSFFSDISPPTAKEIVRACQKWDGQLQERSFTNNIALCGYCGGAFIFLKIPISVLPTKTRFGTVRFCHQWAADIDEKPNCQCLFNHLMYCSSVKDTRNKGTSVHVVVSFGAGCNQGQHMLLTLELQLQF